MHMSVVRTLGLPRWSDLPEISLYLDQVLAVVHDATQSFAYKDEERLLTGSMVNNYVKIGLIDKPVKKKYSRAQVAQLIIITCFKRVFSIPEIQLLFSVQQNSYAIDKAYNYVVGELSDALRYEFAKSDQTTGHKLEQRRNRNNEKIHLLEAMVAAFAAKIYVQHQLLIEQGALNSQEEGKEESVNFEPPVIQAGVAPTGMRRFY